MSDRTLSYILFLVILAIFIIFASPNFTTFSVHDDHHHEKSDSSSSSFSSSSSKHDHSQHVNDQNQKVKPVPPRHKPQDQHQHHMKNRDDENNDDANNNNNHHHPHHHNDDNNKHHHHDEEDHHDNEILVETPGLHKTSHFDSSLANRLKQPKLPAKILQLYSGSTMPKFNAEEDDQDDSHSKPMKKCKSWAEKESSSNEVFAKVWSRLLREKFPPEKGGALDGSGLHWFLDEGGLIGSSRAGALRNADDDFDFFLLLPHQHAPCRKDSLTCTPEEYHKMIHDFLMVFHNEGMCINKFSPDVKRFKTRGRLMFSFQLNRGNADPERCFQENKPFSHMHLGIFNEMGEICTNIWIPAHSTHIKDRLHLDDMLPVTRCRAGKVEAPCPQNITGFLTVRNGGEYRKRSADGSCLVVKKKWGAARKRKAADTLRELDKCGYNSIIDLLPEFISSDYKSC